MREMICSSSEPDVYERLATVNCISVIADEQGAVVVAAAAR